jgi:N-acetylmuramic acid 6-phosphate (MurNAc-6-P) etherase
LDRAVRIIVDASDIDYKHASELLRKAGSVKTAIVMAKLGVDSEEAVRLLAAAKGRIGQALEWKNS